MNLIKVLIILGLIVSSNLAVLRDQDKVQENVQDNYNSENSQGLATDKDDEVSLLSSDDDEGKIIFYKL